MGSSRIPLALSRDCYTPGKCLSKERCGVSGRETWWLQRGRAWGSPRGCWHLHPKWPPPCAPWQWEEKLGVWEWAHAADLGWLPQNDRYRLVFKMVMSDFFYPRKRETGTSLLLFCFSFHSPWGFFSLILIFLSFYMSLFPSAVSAAVLAMSTDSSGCCILQFQVLHLFIFVPGIKTVKIAYSPWKYWGRGV